MNTGSDSGSTNRPTASARPLARLAGALSRDLRHATDLARLSGEDLGRWTEALAAEARFQIAGMLNAVEMAIVLELADGPGGQALANIGPNHCSGHLEAALALLAPETIDHLRLRAALARIARQDDAQSLPVAAATGALMLDGPYLQALTALKIAEQRWTVPMFADAPLRPDLPAEAFCDLAWTSAALLIDAVGGSSPSDSGAIVAATETVIARHDEGQGAFALAQRCAHALSSDGRRSLAPAAVADHRPLLFCALVEAETGVALETVLSIMIDGPDERRCALMRAVDLDDALVFKAGEMLAGLGRDFGDDEALAALVERYRGIDTAAAQTLLVPLAMPAALAAKLALLDRPA